MGRHQAKKASLQKRSSVGNQHYEAIFMSYSASVGRRVQYSKTCEAQTLLHFICTRGTAVILIISEA